MGLHEYRIVSRIAAGSFGVVFKVRRILDDKELVMKRIPLQDLDKSERLEAAQEVFVMGGLHHPYVVAQRDAFLFNDNDLCLVMDYYDGGDLDAAIAKQRDADAYFDFDQVMLWLVEMVLALHCLHSHGILHRDMKTRNLFLNKRTNAVAVGDFGIAERIDGEKAHAVAAAATWRQQQTLLLRHRSSSATSASARAGTAADTSGQTHFFPSTTTGDATTAALGPLSPNVSRREAETPIKVGVRRSSASLPQRPLLPPLDGSASYMNPSESSPYSTPRHPGNGPLNKFAVAAGGGDGAIAKQGHDVAGGFESSSKRAAIMKGTPLYMAPEALQGDSSGIPVGPTSDVWSLGCILYELLCLRHPFESRDISALVVRVARGEREPLPPHYPAAVQDLVDRMLTLDPRSRPSCRDILAMPIVAAYLRRLQSLHIPTTGPNSPEETALAEQLREFVTDAAMHTDEDSRFFRQQVMMPQCTPAQDRELVESRRQEAAQRAALHMMQASAQSSLTNVMGGTFSSMGIGENASGSFQPDTSSAGTFFVGRTTPFGLMVDGAMPSFSAVQSVNSSDSCHQQHDHLQQQRRRQPCARHSTRPDEGGRRVASFEPDPVPIEEHTRNRRKTADVDTDRADGRYSGSNDAEDDEEGGSTVISSAFVQKETRMPFELSHRARNEGSPVPNMDSVRQLSKESASTHGSSSPEAGPHQDRGPSPSVQLSTRPTARNNAGRPPNTSKADVAMRRLDQAIGTAVGGRRPSRELSHPAVKKTGSTGPSIDDVFFERHRNVCDMRDRPATFIAEEVIRMRAVVQYALRERQRLRDARSYWQRFGTDLLPTMPATFREVSPPKERRPVTSPAETAPQPQLCRRLSSAPASSSFAPPDVRAPAASVQRRATTQPQLRTYLARRAALVQRVLRRLSPDALADVYAYYQRTSIAHRDPHEVARMVADREKWPVLPLVEDIVVLDRYLEGSC